MRLLFVSKRWHLWRYRAAKWLLAMSVFVDWNLDEWHVYAYVSPLRILPPRNGTQPNKIDWKYSILGVAWGLT